MIEIVQKCGAKFASIEEKDYYPYNVFVSTTATPIDNKRRMNDLLRIMYKSSDRVKVFVQKLMQVGTNHSIGACTTFYKYGDPKKTVLESYHSCCDSLWVTDRIEKSAKGDADFGCVKIIYRFDGSVDAIMPCGNAFRYF